MENPSGRHCVTLGMDGFGRSDTQPALRQFFGVDAAASAFAKGLEALAVKLLMSAARQGVRGQLYAQLKDLDELTLQQLLESMVSTHVIHAIRRFGGICAAGLGACQQTGMARSNDRLPDHRTSRSLR